MSASKQPPSSIDGILPPGTKAPEFSLSTAPGATLTLSELRGAPVALAFYPADWSPVCGDQMALYNQVLPTFTEYRAAVLGICVDNVWYHKAFNEARN